MDVLGIRSQKQMSWRKYFYDQPRPTEHPGKGAGVTRFKDNHVCGAFWDICYFLGCVSPLASLSYGSF